MQNVSKSIRTTDASITSTINNGRISDIEDKTEEMETLIKENVKCKKSLIQNIQEIWNTIKRPNLRIKEIEGEDYLYKGP